jgi:hypothetical protein
MGWSLQNHQFQAFAGLFVPGVFSARSRRHLNSLHAFLDVVRLHATIQTQTIHAPRLCSQRHAGQLTTN